MLEDDMAKREIRVFPSGRFQVTRWINSCKLKSLKIILIYSVL